MQVSYVGDRVTGTALSLIGVRIFTPKRDVDNIWQAVLDARHGSAIVIVSQDCADLIRERLMDTVIENPLPPIVVMPTLDRDDPFQSRVSRGARQALGLEQTN